MNRQALAAFVLPALLAGCGPSDLSSLGTYKAVLRQSDPYFDSSLLVLKYDDVTTGCVTLEGMTARVNGVDVPVNPGGTRTWMSTSLQPVSQCEHPTVSVPHAETLGMSVVIELTVRGETVVVEASGYGKELPTEIELPEGGARVGGTVTLALGEGWQNIGTFSGLFGLVEGHFPGAFLEVVDRSADGRLTVRLPAELPPGRMTIDSSHLEVAPTLIRCEGAPSCETDHAPLAQLSVTVDVAP